MWSSGPEATTKPTGSKDMRRRSTALRRPADTPIRPPLPTRAAPDMAMVVRHLPTPLIPKTTSLLLRTDIQISNLPLMTAARARASRTYLSRHCHRNSNSASGRDSLLTISELQISLVRKVVTMRRMDTSDRTAKTTTTRMENLQSPRPVGCVERYREVASSLLLPMVPWTS